MGSNYHYYSFADYLVDQITQELYSLFPEDQQEWILTRRHFLYQYIGNLFGFKCNRGGSIITLLTEIESLRDKTVFKDNHSNLHGYLDDLKSLIQDYQIRENIDL